MRSTFLQALALILFVAPAPARAGDYPLFVEFFGPDGRLIEGPISVRPYNGTTEGLAFLFRWIANHDPLTGLPTGAPRPSKLTVTIPVGPQTPQLAALQAKGLPLASVVFHFVAQDVRGNLSDFYKIIFEDVHIISYALSLPDRLDPLARVRDEEETLELVYTGLEQGGYRVEQLRYLPGDTNGDLNVDISDPILLLGYLFLGSYVRCPLSGDVNGDAELDISDAVAELNYLFSGGRPPPAPFPQCGVLPPGAAIPCDSSSCDTTR